MKLEERAPTRVRAFFRAIGKGLLAASDEAVADHAGLIGGHREVVCREYLSKVLPRRYDIGRGMVYGMMHRSRESDIVLWDASNFPRLQMADHSFFFAESVRAIVEIKSRWSAKEFEDIRDKVRAARDIVQMRSSNLADELDLIRLDIAALKMGEDHDGIVMVMPHIGTAAIALRGGQSVDQCLATPELLATADDDWPDALLLLEAGKFILKRYAHDDKGHPHGQLEFYELGGDALLAFTAALLDLLAERVVHNEAPLYFEMYTGEALEPPTATKRFPLLRPLAHRHPLWRRG